MVVFVSHATVRVQACLCKCRDGLPILDQQDLKRGEVRGAFGVNSWIDTCWMAIIKSVVE
jgi:hypothetical protein